jgi:uncharacterized protein YegP (UPF0339 family)
MSDITRRTALKTAARIVSVLIPAVAFPSHSSGTTQDSTLKFEIYKDSRGGFRWRLKAANGRVVATSGEAYKVKADCRNAIDLVKRGAATASVVDLA